MTLRSSQIEELRAAVEKLEGLRDDAGHDWRAYQASDSRWAIGRWEDYGGHYDIPQGEAGIIQSNVVVSDAQRETVDLIVALHATIDAQLTILEKALADAEMAATHTWFNAGQLTRPGLILARAINGGA